MLYITPIKSSHTSSTLSKSTNNDTKVNIVDSSYGTRSVRLVNKGSRVVFQNNMDCFVRQRPCITAKQTYEERREKEKKRKEKKTKKNGAWKPRTYKINAWYRNYSIQMPVKPL